MPARTMCWLAVLSSAHVRLLWVVATTPVVPEDSRQALRGGGSVQVTPRKQGVEPPQKRRQRLLPKCIDPQAQCRCEPLAAPCACCPGLTLSPCALRPGPGARFVGSNTTRGHTQARASLRVPPCVCGAVCSRRGGHCDRELTPPRVCVPTPPPSRVRLPLRQADTRRKQADVRVEHLGSPRVRC